MARRAHRPKKSDGRFTAAVEKLESRRLLAVGLLDTSFNSPGGKRVLDFGGVLDEVYDVAVAPDGKLVAAGYKSPSNTFGAGGDFVVVRLLDNGTLDPGFGTGGIKTLDFNGDVELAQSLLVQPDGKIVVGGTRHTTTDTFNKDWELFRLSGVDGSLDASFGIGGRVTVDFGSEDVLHDLAVQSDGKIVATGLGTDGNNMLGLARFSADGVPDDSFSGDGKVATLINDNLSEGYSVAIQNDGKIVVSCDAASNGAGGGTKTIGIARFESNGTLDVTLKGKGYAVDNAGTAVPMHVAVAPGGGYYVLAFILDSKVTQVRKYTDAGNLDTGFGGGTGVVTISNGGWLGGDTGEIAVESNGNLVVATLSSPGTGYTGSTTIARLRPNGTFDSNFGVAGKTVYNFGSDAVGLTLDREGRAVVVTSAGLNSEMFRLTSEGVGSAGGSVFLDLNSNFTKDADEQNLAGWKVFIDLNLNLTLDAGERWTLTDSAGSYVFDQLNVANPPGGYPIRASTPAGYASTLGWSQAFVSPAGTHVNAGAWPIRLSQSIAGTVFNDPNSNGVQDGAETGIADWDVYLDLNNNGAYDGGAAPTTFAATDTPKTVPDPGLTTSNITVSGMTGNVTDIDVALNINHTWDEDLTATLISPSGKRVTLFSAVGSNGDNFIQTKFDDEATTPIASGAAPFTGTFKPAQPLSGFDGEPANGIWKLEVTDVTAPDPGTLLGWSITVSGSAGEPKATTDASGNFLFSGLANGTYRVRQVLESGYRKTQPGTGISGVEIVVAGGAGVGGIRFGNTTNILLAGTVYDDANFNGLLDTGETGLAGVTVEIVSNNTVVATRVTDAAGKWQVKGLSAGTGEARIVIPTGQVAAAPVGGVYAGSMSAGQQNANLNFGLRPAATAPFAATTILRPANVDPLIAELV